jgi:lipopolysaccharide cholinephosphotransferase
MRIYNPEGSSLRKDQLEMLKVLEAFADICKKNDITWWLCSGTLLGAARHKGFIPWDDDIDVTMLKKDYRKLEKILAKLDSEDYFYQSIRTDPDHVNAFGKFRKKKDPVASTDKRSKYFKYQGVGLDVFCIEKSNRFASHLAKFMYVNMQHPTQYIKNAFLRHLVIKIVQVLNFGLLIPVARVIGRLFNPNDEYRINLGAGFYKSKFFMKDIFPLSTMEFEAVEFPVPGDTDAYLTTIYGDWRKLPSDEQIKKSMHYPQYIKEIFGEE